MATSYTKAKTLGDVVRSSDQLRSYESLVVDQNQTLVVGDALARGTNGRLVAAGASSAPNCAIRESIG